MTGGSGGTGGTGGTGGGGGGGGGVTESGNVKSFFVGLGIERSAGPEPEYEAGYEAPPVYDWCRVKFIS
jgi:hypothetical protein